jgi:hypothetical protein
MKYPRRAQLRDIFSIDLAQTAVSLSGVVPIVRRPVFADRAREQVFRAHVRTAIYGSLFVLLRGRWEYGGENKKQNQKCLTARLHVSVSPRVLAEFPAKTQGPTRWHPGREAKCARASPLEQLLFRATRLLLDRK